MREVLEIKGGAGVFEAAVIAVILDHLDAEGKTRGAGHDANDNRLPAWVTAINPYETFPVLGSTSRSAASSQ